MSKQKLDWPNLIASVTIILVASIALVLFPESGARLLTDAYTFISGQFAFVYLMAGVVTLSLLTPVSVMMVSCSTYRQPLRNLTRN